MLSEDDIYSIGRRYQEKRAAMGPVGIGALGGAGFGLLTHLLRPKDKDDRGLGSAILSVLTGAGLGAAGGLAYKSLGSNPFDPGPSQPAPANRNKPVPPPPKPDVPDAGDVLRDLYGSDIVQDRQDNVTKPISAPAVSRDEATAIAGSGVASPTVSAPEALAIAATTGMPTPGGETIQSSDQLQPETAGQPAVQADQPAVQAVSPTVTTPQADGPVLAAPTQNQQQAPQKEQQASKKEAFKPGDRRSVLAYEQLAAAHPDRTITPEELSAEILSSRKQYGPAPLVTVDNKGGKAFVPDVPFIMTHDIAWSDDNNKNGILDPQVWFAGDFKEKLAKAADNNWPCVADRLGRIFPLYKLENNNFIVAVGDPLWDPTRSPVDKVVDGIKATTTKNLNAVKNPVVRAWRTAKDRVVDGIDSTLDSLRK